MKLKIPRPYEVNEKIAPLQEQLNGINDKIHPLRDELYDVRYRLDAECRPNLGNDLDNRVLVARGKAPQATRESDFDRLGTLLNELNVLNLAAEQIITEIHREEGRSAVAICNQVRPEHDRLAQDFAKKFVELHRAHTDYEAFLDSVTNVGISYDPLNPVRPNGLGHPRDQSGSYYYAFKELKDAGHLRELPKELRPH